MKKLIIKEITLSNWKAQNVKITFFDDKTFISGKNGSGKTSVMKAFCWLLTGFCDPDTPKNSDLFDNRKQLSFDTPEASVEAVIDIDGLEYKIRRVAKCKFVRPRGSDTWVKDKSDEYKLFIDDIPYSQTDFDDWFSCNVCPISFAVNVINGDFFINLAYSDRKKAREVLSSIIGDVKRSEMTGDYSAIAELMKKYKIDDIEKQARMRISEISNRAEELPTLISAKNSELDTLERNDFMYIREQIKEKKNEIDKIDNALLGRAEAENKKFEEREKVLEKKRNAIKKLDAAGYKYERKFEDERRRLNILLEDAKAYNTSLANRKETNDKMREQRMRIIESQESRLKALEDERISLLKENSEVKSMVFTDTNCAFCGAPLSEDMIEKNREKFNEEKKAKIDIIVRKGKSVSEEISKMKKMIDEMKEKNSYDDECDYGEPKDTDKISEDLAKLKESYIPFNETEEYKILKEEADSYIVEDINVENSDALIRVKRSYIEELEMLNRTLGLETRLGEVKKELDEMSAEYKNVGASLAKHELILSKCKEFAQEKADIVSKKVNVGLKYSNISMWSMQKDGRIIPDLVIMKKDGVRYETANGASRILIAVDLQTFFCDMLGISMPVWVDECNIMNESNLPYSDDYQYIYMFCSDSSSITVNNNK